MGSKANKKARPTRRRKGFVEKLQLLKQTNVMEYLILNGRAHRITNTYRRKKERSKADRNRQTGKAKKKQDRQEERNKRKGFVQISSDPEKQRLETETTSALCSYDRKAKMEQTS